MHRFAAFLILSVLLLLPACGTGTGDPTSTIVAGPFRIALPFLPETAGESATPGLKNLAASDAPVVVTAYRPDGTPYGPGPVGLVVPARGGLRPPLGLFTGLDPLVGGWLEVETRDPADLDAVTGEPSPVATSGFVVPYLKRTFADRSGDAYRGLALDRTAGHVTLTESTTSYQIVNASFDPQPGGATPEGVDVDITVYDAAGAVFGTFLGFVDANGSLAVSAGGVGVGRVEVEPAPPPFQSAPPTTEFRLGVAAREDDPQVLIETRFMEVDRTHIAQLDLGLDLSFGMDLTGNVHDFAVVMSNTSPDPVSILINAISRTDGVQILSSPRVIALDGRATKLQATTTLHSRGLEVGESSVFDDLFGDVGSATTLQSFTIHVVAPREVDVSARHLDSIFKSFFHIVSARSRTNQVAVMGLEVRPTLPSGTRNYLTITNPTTSAQDVFPRGYTPGGTEYVLPTLNVGPLRRVDWSPDGMVFREDPSDPTAPAVPFMSFELSASGGLFFGARRERRDATELIELIAPWPVRDLRAE